MSYRPGVSVIPRTSPRPRSAPTDTGIWHVVGLAETGPADRALLVTSMADFERLYGPRQSYSVLYDALDLYFQEGGSRSYVSRVVGPAAAIGTKNLNDAGAAVALVAKATGPGAGSSNISIGVRTGVTAGTFIIYVVVNAVEVETSPDLLDNNAAVNWALSSNYIRLSLGASALDPAVATATALSAGNDDRNNITDANWLTALNNLSSDNGPGQVSAPGQTTNTRHLQLLTHAKDLRRVAILDAPDSATQATVTSAATAARAGGNGRYGAMFWPWLVTPGIAYGTSRSMPPSAFVAGNIARNDARDFGPSDPAAGDAGDSFYASDLTQPALTDPVRQQFNEASINVIRRMFGGVRTYGWRSIADPVGELDWRNFGSARLYMAIASSCAAIAEGFVFDKIDGQGKKIAEFNGALTGVCMGFYNSGDIYGLTPAEGFYVDTGNQVNTPTTLANDELRAIINVRMSPFAEYVQIEIVKRRIEEGVL